MKLTKSSVKRLKSDFPIFMNRKNITYLDNAATTQKPKQVIDSVADFYSETNANIHRGLYKLSMEATKMHSDARDTVAQFINASSDEIVFTSGTTDSINMLSNSIKSIIPSGRKKIVVTEIEHHSNLIPWQELAKREGYTLDFIKLTSSLELDERDLKKVDKNTAIFAFTMVSNSIGLKVDVEKFCKAAKEVGALSVIDGAQAIAHIPVDVKQIGCDFFAFSGHKVLGPSGIGVLYGRRELLEKMSPSKFGGGMVHEVTYLEATFTSSPQKFEAGTPNIEGAVALAEALRYLTKIGMDNVLMWEREITSYAFKKISEIKGVTIYAPSNHDKLAGIISFNIEGIHPHDMSSIADDLDVCIRAGHHCCMPLMNKLGLSGTARASFYIYNTFEDVNRLCDAIQKAKKIFGV